VISLGDTVVQLDRALGERLSDAVCRHHARRLHGLGSGALNAPSGGWADDAAPPRPGTRLELLVDGRAALAAIAGAVASASSHVHVTGWFLSPEFVMADDGDHQVVVRELLAEAARRVDVRVLMWAGAPLPAFTPSRRMARAVRDELERAGPIQCALDDRERPLHCHHEKTVVVDDRIAFVGGIDWTELSGDRLDGPAHPPRARLGWHDASMRLGGPIVADVAGHFAMRWEAVTGERLPEPVVPPAEPEGVEAQFVRTCPERVYPAVRDGCFGVLESYMRALRSAERLIYLETQYLWSPELVSVLADKLRSAPDDRFRLVLVLPSRPKGGGDDTRGALAELIEADAGAGRVLACCLFARSAETADPVYVHAKVGIVDDRWLTVGSANLNDHSLFNDTEANVVTHDAATARAARLALWSEHLERPVAEIDGDPADVVDRIWRPTAEEQLERLQAGRPLTHRLTRLDHVSRRSARLLGPLQGLLVDG
jgi:phosphatidylserine/phosphatidylglycerophosphate/cardiolipin synthase-like enzyme